MCSLSRVFVHPAVFFNRSSLAELRLEIAYFCFFYRLKEREGRSENTLTYFFLQGSFFIRLMLMLKFVWLLQFDVDAKNVSDVKETTKT